MRIEELPGDSGGGGGGEVGEEKLPQLRREDGAAAVEEGEGGVVMRVAVDAKRAAVGVGARLLFYPTLCYNVVRNRLEAHFHWWDQVDEHVLLGAVPFPSDVLRLKELGVCGVVTLNESYERLVPKSLYEAHGIDNLVLPTRDYLYAPSFVNLCEAADFVHRNASCGKLTYVHCKAGRGRSTTVVLCYLAVQEFYQLRVKKTGGLNCPASCPGNTLMKPQLFLATRNLFTFDDNTFVVVSESDLEGYNADALAVTMGSGLWEISLVYRVQFASKAALAGFSYLWFRCRAHNKEVLPENVGGESCSREAEQHATSHPSLLRSVVVNP
ncbi:phosphatidylglycerophosphate phosphatase PTPMT1-like isoform X2 [Phragmites australis]|uniref:phosphatidylglycerophosphate phosphatase PTPMT1-like isoform X2 n=1 Tax=Phragmites australis TaxID=29695 RepID=UPI002D774C3A|nr:phosphatidylglycerophosphate phosphatase PTPMT1-like isoform X2 [Phragmites australis]